jgi:glycerophosphoryl diester phosphodiesterase
MIDSGADGIITDYPDRLRDVMAESGMKLPKAFELQAGR